VLQTGTGGSHVRNWCVDGWTALTAEVLCDASLLFGGANGTRTHDLRCERAMSLPLDDDPEVAPRDGLEPPTNALTARRSTAELPGNKITLCYTHAMAEIKRRCETCGDSFSAERRYVNRGHGRFCSRSCSASRKRKTTAPNLVCAHCGTPFYRRAAHLCHSKSGIRFCSRACKDISQRIGGIAAIQPDHYGVVETKYRTSAFRNYDAVCVACGYDRSTETLVVHHVDGDRTNNKIKNLAILCPTCHAEIHAGIRHPSRPFELVDRVGSDPTTSGLQNQRSPKLS
jgi:hypothetical protein